jgi:hypothetical protein
MLMQFIYLKQIIKRLNKACTDLLIFSAPYLRFAVGIACPTPQSSTISASFCLYKTGILGIILKAAA